jgi:hypothetical protein
MEPIVCPECQGPPVQFSQTFAGHYQCAKKHVFHRCLKHRQGVPGASPLENAPKHAQIYCTCPLNSAEHVPHTCPWCSSLWLPDPHRTKKGHCLSCHTQLYYCPQHRKWGRFRAPEPGQCTCQQLMPPPELDMNREVLSPSF